MRDKINQEFKVNDNVIFVAPYSNKLSLGTISQINAKTISVKYNNTECNRTVDKVLIINKQLEHSKEVNVEYFI